MSGYASDDNVSALAARFGSDQGVQDDRIGATETAATAAGDAAAVADAKAADAQKAKEPPYTPFASRADAEAAPKDTVDAVSAQISGRVFSYLRSTAGTALGAGWQPADVPNVLHWGAEGNDALRDTAAFVAALSWMKDTGGGDLIVPRTAAPLLISDPQFIPNNVTLRCEGTPNALNTGSSIVYSGTGAAFSFLEAESDLMVRGADLRNIGLTLTAAGATGFRVWRARDITMAGCSVRMEADGQTGFHIKGEREAGTYGGVFDCHFDRLISYSSSATNTGAVHYKLTGTLNNGQVNANLFSMIRGGGSGTFCTIGPSDGNTFVAPEAEAITGDYFSFQSYAYNNKVYGGYIEAQAAWAGKVMRTAANTTRNVMDAGTIGVNATADDIVLTAGNAMRWGPNRAYVAVAGESVMAGRLAGDAFNRGQFGTDGISLGDGTAAPTLMYGARHKRVQALVLSASVAFDTALGHIGYLNIDAATDPTLQAPTNANEGDEVTIHIINNSGTSRTITWGAGWVKASFLTGPLTAGQRFTARFFKQGPNFYLLGNYAIM